VERLASPARNFTHLPDIAGRDGHSGANRHPVTLRANHLGSVIQWLSFLGLVEKERGRSATLKTRMSSFPSLLTSPMAVPRRDFRACIQAGIGGNLTKRAVCLIEEKLDRLDKRWFAGRAIEQGREVARSHKKILPAAVVKVCEVRSPLDERKVGAAIPARSAAS